MADRFDVDTEEQQRCIVGYWRTNKKVTHMDEGATGSFQVFKINEWMKG